MNTTTIDPKAMSWDEIKQAMAENYSQMLETRLQMQETDRRMKELQGLFTTQWGKLIEALTKPAALKLFKEKGIKITQIYRGAHFGEWDTGAMEVDVILCNTVEAVAVEVKTTCKVEDVNYFMKQMEHFKEAFHPFDKCKVYPAIAALQYDENSDIYALKHGLYVLHANGDGLFSLTEPNNKLVL